MVLVPPSSGVFLKHSSGPRFEREYMDLVGMYSGTLIDDLFAAVERIQSSANAKQSQRVESRTSRADSRTLRIDSQANVCHCTRETSEAEQFPQPLGLRPADRNLGLLFVIHAQLVRALEPGNDFADAIDIHQVGAVRPPKKIRV